MNNPLQPNGGNRDPMPMEARKQQAEGRRSQNRSECVPFLEDAGECAAALFGQGFKSERGAYAPFATHGNSKQGPQYQQDIERGRKCASELDDGEANDIGHEHGTTAIAVRQHAEQERADGTKGLGEEYRSENRRGLCAELAGNGVDAKDEQKEVEAVESPAKKCGQKNMALGAGELPEWAEERHRREHNRLKGKSMERIQQCSTEMWSRAGLVYV